MLDKNKLYLLKKSLSFLKAPAFILDNKGNILESLLFYSQENDAISSDIKLREKLILDSQHKEFSAIYEDEEILYFCFNFAVNNYLVIGPLSFNTIDSSKTLIFCQKHNISFCPILTTASEGTKNIIELLYFILFDKELSNFSIDFQNDSKKDKLDETVVSVYDYHLNIEKPHNPDNYEKEIRQAVASGDVDNILKKIHASFAGVRGRIATTNLRNAKNLAIVDVTIISRQAIDVGLSSEKIYTIGDAYLLEIEKAKSIEEIDKLHDKAAIEFTTLVKDFKKDPNELSDERVNKAIDYINKNVSKMIKVQDIADMLNVSCDYLQTLFVKYTKKSIIEYVRDNKIEIAKRLLKNSNKRIEEISLMLGFENSSNFITFFKTKTGITPLKYRNKEVNDSLKG